MADRYPDRDYGRDSARGRFSRSERWGDEEDWRRGRRRGAGFESREDDDRRGAGAYGGAYGQGSSGNYAGGYDRSLRDDDFDRGYGEYGQAGMRGQSYGGGYRDREDYDRAYGLEGSGYSRQGQSMGQGGYGRSQYGQGGNFGQEYEPGQGYRASQQGYGQGFQDQGQFGGYSQGMRPTQGFGAQSFGQASGYGSEQSGSFLSRGGRAQWGRHSGRGPKNYTRPDDRIRDDINDRLTDDPEIDASEIEVKVTSCEVTLSGTVDSRQAKRRAEDCADSVSGVKHVQNNLRVQSQDQRSENEQARNVGKKNKAGDGEERMQ